MIKNEVENKPELFYKHYPSIKNKNKINIKVCTTVALTHGPQNKSLSR